MTMKLRIMKNNSTFDPLTQDDNNEDVKECLNLPQDIGWHEGVAAVQVPSEPHTAVLSREIINIIIINIIIININIININIINIFIIIASSSSS